MKISLVGHLWERLYWAVCDVSAVGHCLKENGNVCELNQQVLACPNSVKF